MAEIRDLGLGSRIAETSGGRMLNRDGTFNVFRRGFSWRESLSLYHTVITMRWTSYYAMVIAGFLVVNLLFATLYYLCGPGALQGGEGVTSTDRFLDDFFFSVQTLATVGYGRIFPRGLLANGIATVEVLVGLLGLSLATGILFARFSRPTARILFSRNAVIAPFQGGHALMFRVVNGRNNELTNVQATVSVGFWDHVDGRRVRRFHALTLERPQVMLFPLHWVVVHPIDDQSPFHGWTEAEFAGHDPEVLVVLIAHDETFSQNVTARSSYKPEDVVWGARFVDMFCREADGRLGSDMRKLHDLERAT